MYVAPSVIDGAGSVLDSDERIKQLIDELKAEQAGAQERRSNSIDAQRRGSGEAKRDGRNSGDAKRTSSSEFGRRKSTDNKLQRGARLRCAAYRARPQRARVLRGLTFSRARRGRSTIVGD
jgi:hypothetical protein